MSDTDRERVLIVLRLAAETCASALSALVDTSSSTSLSEGDADAALDVRIQDYMSLLSLLYHDTTKLGIALKPSSPTYRAAITPMKDLATHIDALASCARSIDTEKHGGALMREIRWVTEEVVGALASLLGVYTDNVDPSRNDDAHGADSSYLAKTGAVHEAIDRARGLSRSNKEAVSKRWEVTLLGIADCAKEVEEMVEDEQEAHEDGDEYGEESEDLKDDDGDWGELGLSPPSRRDEAKASEEELAHLKTAQQIFKLTQALLKRVSNTLLEAPEGGTIAPPRTWDGVLRPVDLLLKAADDFVNALYVPQDPSNVSRALTAIITLVHDLHVSLSSLGYAEHPVDTDDAEVLVSRLKSSSLVRSTVGVGAVLPSAKDKKWFNACFEHIRKVAGDNTVPNTAAT